MPNGDFDPVERVTAPVGAPAPAPEATEEFLSPDESPEELAERIREEEFEGEPGKGGDLRKKPDVMVIQVKGRLNTAMRLANSANVFLNRVSEVAQSVVRKFYGGPGILSWVLKPSLQDQSLLAVLRKETNLPPEQFHKLVDVAKDLELNAASLEKFDEYMAGPNNLFIQFADIVEEENKRTETTLREFLVMKPDQVKMRETLRHVESLVEVQELVLGEAKKGAPGKSFNLKISLEHMEALAESIETLNREAKVRRKRIEENKSRVISYLFDAGIKVKSSLVFKAQEPAVMERTQSKTELSAAAMSAVSDYVDAVMEIQPTISFLIAQSIRWNNVVNQTNAALKQLSDANNQFLAAIQPTLT